MVPLHTYIAPEFLLEYLDVLSDHLYKEQGCSTSICYALNRYLSINSVKPIKLS